MIAFRQAARGRGRSSATKTVADAQLTSRRFAIAAVFRHRQHSAQREQPRLVEEPRLVDGAQELTW
jgi:hypothetical protein